MSSPGYLDLHYYNGTDTNLGPLYVRTSSSYQSMFVYSLTSSRVESQRFGTGNLIVLRVSDNSSRILINTNNLVDNASDFTYNRFPTASTGLAIATYFP